MLSAYIKEKSKATNIKPKYLYIEINVLIYYKF